MKWQLIDLFHKGGLLTYSLICMIISLSGLVSMCKVQKNSDFQTRPERLIIIRIKGLLVKEDNSPCSIYGITKNILQHQQFVESLAELLEPIQIPRSVMTFDDASF